MLVIEHNLDVIKTADWIVDLGPEGGDGGGRVVAEGPPEVVAKVPESYTGRFLAKVLKLEVWRPRLLARVQQRERLGSRRRHGQHAGEEGAEPGRGQAGRASHTEGLRRRNRAMASVGACSAGSGGRSAEKRSSVEPGGIENSRWSGVRAHGSVIDSVVPAGSVTVTCPAPPLSTVAVNTTGRGPGPGLWMRK